MADEKTYRIQHEGQTYEVPAPQGYTYDQSVTYQGLTTDFTREAEVRVEPKAPPTLATDERGRVTVDPHLKVVNVREVPFEASSAGTGAGTGFEATISGMNAISGSLQAASGEAAAAAQCDVPRPGDAATVFACVSAGIGTLDDMSTGAIAKTARGIQGTADTVKGGAAAFADGDALVAGSLTIGRS